MRPNSRLHSGRLRKQGGFTLMELLVSSIMISVVLAGVYTAFGTALITWRAGEAGIRNAQSARIATMVMAQELQSIVRGSEYLIEGENDEITFYAVTRPMNVEEGNFSRIVEIRYRLKNDPKSRNKILVREEGLVDGPLPLVTPETKDDIETTKIKVKDEEDFEVASGIADLEFSYYWVPGQEEAEEEGESLEPQPAPLVVKKENRKGWGLPQGIKIEMTIADPNAEKGKTTLTSFVAFHGPTTPLGEEGGPEEGGLS